jgi:hypothetical protein
MPVYTVYAGLGYGTQRQLLVEAGWTTLGFGAGCIAFFVVDRLPRPALIAGGIAECMVMLILEAALVASFAGSSNTADLKAAVAMIYIYVVFYECALDGTQFVYLGEMFPSYLRANGMSLGVAGICIMKCSMVTGSTYRFCVRFTPPFSICLTFLPLIHLN